MQTWQCRADRTGNQSFAVNILRPGTGLQGTRLSTAQHATAGVPRSHNSWAAARQHFFHARAGANSSGEHGSDSAGNVCDGDPRHRPSINLRLHMLIHPDRGRFLLDRPDCLRRSHRVRLHQGAPLSVSGLRYDAETWSCADSGCVDEPHSRARVPALLADKWHTHKNLPDWRAMTSCAAGADDCDGHWHPLRGGIPAQPSAQLHMVRLP